MIDETIEKNLKRCSRCALCLKNCPIYDIKKDENQTSRALIVKLLGFLKGDLNKKELKRDLKICLNCSKCKQNCPSKVNTSMIFAYKNAKLYPSKISQRIFLNLKLLPIKFLYFINFFKSQKKITPQSNDMYYFKGCMSLAQHKTTFLDEAFLNPGFACCGMPYYIGGDIKNYNRAKEKNISLIKNSKHIIFDCSSCYSAILDYEELTQKDKDKLIFITDLFNNINLKLKETSKYKNKTITFHKPCHMKEDDFEKAENLLSKIKGINYKKLENHNTCCGFGGSYFIFHPIISTLIAIKKAITIKKSKADLILTTCPSCTIGLRFNQIISMNFKKTLELRDFIQKECIIE